MLVPLGRGRQPQGPPQMGTPWMMPVTMNPGGQGADLENIPGFRPGMEMPVTTASIPMPLLPKSRLMEAVEFTEPLLDVTITTTLDPPYLAIIIWELTRVGVDTHVRTFNCGSYVELFLRFRNAYERRKRGAAEAELKRYVDGFKDVDGASLRDYVTQNAMKLGFRPETLEPTPKKAKKGGAKALAKASVQQAMNDFRGVEAPAEEMHKKLCQFNMCHH